MDQATQVQPPVQPESSQEVVTQIPESPPKRSPKILIIAGLVIVIVIGGGALAYILLQKPQPKPTPIVQIPTPPSPAPTQPAQTASQTGSQTISLRDVNGGSSYGEATRSIVPGNASLVLDATLPDPNEDNFYQAWVVNAEGDFISLGRLSRNSQGAYSTSRTLEVDSLLPPNTEFDKLHNITVITLESVDDDSMETKILEGTFTQ